MVDSLEIKQYLKQQDIPFKTFEHPAVYTCEEAKQYTQGMKGIAGKNLFLKNKKSTKFYLVILPPEKRLDMNRLGEHLGEKVKFANEDDLLRLLQLTAGAVSPFGLIYDKTHEVEVVIDKEVYASAFVCLHPNINTETLELSREGFRKFLQSLSITVKVLEA